MSHARGRRREEVYRGGVQTRCTDEVYRRGVQTRCTDEVYRRGVQTRCTDEVHRRGAQTRCTDEVYSLHVHCTAQQLYPGSDVVFPCLFISCSECYSHYIIE